MGIDGFFVMRRANGDLLALKTNGESVIPVWSSEDAAARYKRLNPQLNIFWPVRLERGMINRTTGEREREGTAELILLAETSPAAELDDGRRVTIDDLLSDSSKAHQSAKAHP